MATLQLVPVTALNGTTYATAQIIITPISPDRRKLILPKLEPPSSGSSTCLSPPVTASRAPICNAAVAAATGGYCKPKRKLSFGAGATSRSRPAASVSKRNARERNRVKQVNLGFVTLASHVPSNMRPKKMSKVETLKSAIKYIRYLRQVIDQQQVGCAASTEHSVQGAQSPHAFATTAASESVAFTAAQLATAPAPLPRQPHADAWPQRVINSCPTTAAAAAYTHNAASSGLFAPLATSGSCLPHCDVGVAGFATPPYDVPSPTSSHCSAYSYDDAGWSSSSSSPYETCLSQDEQDLLDFISWFD